ncbi:MAG TPA: hypothetical protein VMT10_04925 [Solirubrobacteraceae bacterium]|nr:hypothetical protein [Solirubrobacteraceae bacterium]
MAELASFRADDADVVVSASLSCPLCLHESHIVALEGCCEDGHARCCCVACGHERVVELLPEQLLRLSLMVATAR